MTLVLVRKLLRDVRWPLLAVCVILFLFSAFWVKIAQRISTEIAPFVNVLGEVSKIPNFKETFDEVIFKGPGKVSQAVMGGSAVQFDNPNDFLAVELLHPIVVILASLWAVSRAAGAICLDLEAEIEFKPGDFYDHVHTTLAGKSPYSFAQVFGSVVDQLMRAQLFRLLELFIARGRRDHPRAA